MISGLAPIIEDSEPADSWANSAEAIVRHQAMKSGISATELEQCEAEYLSRGGVIHEIAPGVSGERTSFNNNSVMNNARHFVHDAEMISKIRELLPAMKQKRDLPIALGCSDDKVQRLLRENFADNPLAKPLMRKPK